jgi:hypothetical protein
MQENGENITDYHAKGPVFALLPYFGQKDPSPDLLGGNKEVS